MSVDYAGLPLLGRKVDGVDSGLLRRGLVPAGIVVLSAALVVLLLWEPGEPAPRPADRARQADATFVPPTSVPESPTASPSPVIASIDEGPPALPETARGLTVPAAAGFVRYYFEQAINHAKVTGDVSAIRTWSAVGCPVCAKNITAYTVANQANGLQRGDHRWRAVTIRQARLTDPRTAVVEMTGAVGNHTYRAGPKAKVMTYKAQTVALRLTLVADQGDWAMFDWERLAR